MSYINSMADQNAKITAATFASKFNSKREVYMFLTVECTAYLPSVDSVSIYFLKDLVSGTKKCKFPSYPN